eukprot:TRINITY_DN35573_c0_g1_i1.p1 TRINITY_DN35573_c0_g1~~TRINITY_DN35573_c0_g1_i1.p1  ORF type:complete len:500 (-),score=75.96 TRINITY_DN35573_c0_g1_i1:1458-2957(-)
MPSVTEVLSVQTNGFHIGLEEEVKLKADTIAEVLPGGDASYVNLKYQGGFGNNFESEAIPGALPVGRNNPQVCPFGLYAEQLSGTAFTAPRSHNLRSWLYRIKPSVTHEPFRRYEGANPSRIISEFTDANSTWTPNQLRWWPRPIPDEPLDFVDGLVTVCGCGNPSSKSGYAIHMYTANKGMVDQALANADGDFLVVPQQGRLWVSTEMGRLEVAPGEILLLPCGIRFSIDLPDGPSRGYVCEVFGAHFQLPELGPIGANGLASARDFQAPVAAFDTRYYEKGFTVLQKFAGSLFEAKQDFSPFNVVAWHGTYAPFKYDLSRFCPMNAVLFDHPDPSIFTVLTCPSSTPGVALLDFAIFPPRWSVAEGTFRPPYFHRNCMSEFMGLIIGKYEAKDGLMPGGGSLHCCMTPHGPDTPTFERGTSAEAVARPQKLPTDSLAFMFESFFIPRVTLEAFNSPQLDKDYYKCWLSLRSFFDPSAISPSRKEQPIVEGNGHTNGA